MRINYLLGLPTFLMIIGLAWATHSHASWYNKYEDDSDLPEVSSLLKEETSPRSGQAHKQAASQEQPAVLELVNQIDSIQRELQELRGQLEIQSHELKLLKSHSTAPAEKVVVPNGNSSLNTSSGLELNTSGITYKPDTK